MRRCFRSQGQAPFRRSRVRTAAAILALALTGTGCASNLPQVKSWWRPGNPVGLNLPFPADGLESTARREKDAADEMARAFQRYRDGDVPGALTAVRRARQRDPSLSSACELEAMFTADLGDRQRQAEALYAVLAANPDSASIQHEAGQMLVHAGLGHLGLAAMERAVRLDPRHSEYARDVAGVYLERGEGASAARVLMEAQRANPSDASLSLSLARVHESAGHWEEALRNYTVALHAAPQNAAWRRQRARCLYRLADYARAAEEFNTCLEVDVQSLTTADRIEFGDACLRCGDLERAAWLFDEVAKGGATTKELEALRAVCALRRGQTAEANQVLAAARQRWPEDVLLMRLAEVDRAAGTTGVEPASGAGPAQEWSLY